MPARCSNSPILLGLIAVAVALGGTRAAGEPRPDLDYRPSIADPEYRSGSGPVVCIDAAHHNFHRVDGLYRSFGDLLLADGYRIQVTDVAFDREVPADCRVLVIANAQPSSAEWKHYPYPTPSAFTDAEVRWIVTWVREGGRLLLIADHMPFPGAAASLAAGFGCRFNDGFAVADFSSEAEGREAFLTPTLFSRQNGLLGSHPIVAGRSQTRQVTQVATFAGQAFLCGSGATALLVLPRDFVSLMPARPWEFTLQTLQVPVGGWLQGAAIEFGAGRVAIFGEGGMFAAQITDDGRPMGMNARGAEQNALFVRNIVDWLSGP